MTESVAAAAAWRELARRRVGVVAVCRVELRKLAAQVPLRFAAAVCLVAPFAFAAMLRVQQAVPADTLFGRWVHASGFAVPLVVLGFAGSWGFPVLAGLVAGDLFSSEDRYGTWKTALTRSCSRFELFAGKTAAAMLCTVGLVALLAVTSLAAGLLEAGDRPLLGLSGNVIPAGHAAGLVLESFGLALVPTLGFTSLALLLSAASRSGIVGVLGPAIAGLVMQLLSLVGSGEVVRTLLLGTGFDAWHGLFASPAFDRPAGQAALVSLAYILLLLGGAWVVVRRRDFAGASPEPRRRWLAPGCWGAAAAAAAALLAVAAPLGPPTVTAGRLDAAITPAFTSLAALQQRELGHELGGRTSMKVLTTCSRRGASTPYRGPGDDWTCAITAVAPDLRQLPLNYDVDVRPNGCYTAHGPTSVGGSILRGRGAGKLNPLYAFDGCFED